MLLLLAATFVACTPDGKPVAMLSAQTTHGAAPLSVAFDLSLCRSVGGEPLRLYLDFGDGTEITTCEDPSELVPHLYEEGGEYTARVVAVDVRGRQAEAELPITVSLDPAIGVEVGMRAPDFEAETVDGGRLALSDARGSVVLLDFWGAWCAPCRRSLPHLQSLLDAFQDDGLQVILVSTDPRPSDAELYLTANGYDDLVCVWAPGGKRGNPIVELYEMAGKGIPRTFVLDRQGIIRYVGHPNHLTGDAIETLL
jgi:thiol-disulfide isomerase/thioredoxin